MVFIFSIPLGWIIHDLFIALCVTWHMDDSWCFVFENSYLHIYSKVTSLPYILQKGMVNIS